MAIRVGDWKATYLENRAHQLQVSHKPFVHLRLPLLCNLRRDPFEKSMENSNTYHDWMIDRAYVLVPLQTVASEFLVSLKEFPPSQKPGDWSLDTLEKQIKSMAVAGRVASSSLSKKPAKLLQLPKSWQAQEGFAILPAQSVHFLSQLVPYPSAAFFRFCTNSRTSERYTAGWIDRHTRQIVIRTNFFR